MNREFEFSDFYFVNNVDMDAEVKSDDISAICESLAKANVSEQLIEISDASGKESSIMCTYAKFLEILDSDSLETLVNP